MNRDTDLSLVVHRAAERATLAPSVHNTQPWRLRLDDGSLELIADRSRRLDVLDPRGRQLTISCGCALLNIRVSLARSGYTPMVTRWPNPADPDLLARVTVGPPRDYLPLAELDDSIPLRRTNRRAYAPEPVPVALLDQLARAATAERTQLQLIGTQRRRDIVSTLVREAEATENSDPAYLAELAAWTTDDPRRRDGVQAATLPYRAPDVAPGSTDQVPIRGFDVQHHGWLPPSSESDEDQCLVLLTGPDGPEGWLKAGEALQRIWLEITKAGYWASPLTQVIEVLHTHRALADSLELSQHPQVLLRVGLAPQVTGSGRRRLDEILVDDTTSS